MKKSLDYLGGTLQATVWVNDGYFDRRAKKLHKNSKLMKVNFNPKVPSYSEIKV